MRVEQADVPVGSTRRFDWNAFARLVETVFDEHDEETIIQNFLELLPSVVDVSFCAISLMPHGMQNYWWAAGRRNNRSLSSRLLDRIAGLSERELAPLFFSDSANAHHQVTAAHVDIRQIEFPDLHTDPLLAVPIKSTRDRFGILLAGKAGTAAYSSDECTCLILLAVQLAQALETVRLYQRSRERDREFDLVYQTGQRITQLLSLDELTAQLVEAVSETFGYQSVTLLLSDEDTKELVVKETYGLRKERHIGFRIPIIDGLRGGIVGWVAHHGQPYIAADVRCEERYIMTVEETRSELAVPLMIKGRVIGVLDVQSTEPKAFTEKDQNTLTMLADQVAISLENARLYEEVAQAHSEIQQTSKQLQHLLERTVNIQEQERQRIAADIHDNVNQLIYGALYEAQAVLQLHPSEPMSDRLRRIQNLLDSAQSEIHKAIFNLWPTSLDEMGLIPSLQSFVSKFGKEFDIDIAIEITGDVVAFESLARINIYRIIQEALHNVQKHADAQSVNIQFAFTPSSVTLCISDDGVGFKWRPLSDGGNRHLGLISIRERARTIGGHLKVESTLGEGTQLRFEFPRHTIEQKS